ncbi:unnamed protein product, partial [Strongylus vulgaris]
MVFLNEITFGYFSECKCFVAKLGYEQARSPLCDACVNARRKKAEEEREELSEKRSGQSSSRSSFELSPAVEATVPEKELKAELKKVDVATPKIQELEENDKDNHFHMCSTDSDSSDSEFEALSYEEEKENKETPNAPFLTPPEGNTLNVAATEVSNNSTPTTTLYPTLVVEDQPAEPVRIGEDQTIANRLIEMGFSAEEVFRVVRMHGCNFE